MMAPADTMQLLLDVRAGDSEAFDCLFARVYDELRGIAHQRLVRHSPAETLNTTALVHEVYLRLVDRTKAGWQDRAHFLALASRAMRGILIDHARRQSAQKRGGGRADVPLDRVQIAAEERAVELLGLDEALERLTRSSERLGRLVEYRFFGGLSYEEIAEVTGRSVPTVKRDWSRARGWLYRYMRAAEA